MEIEINLGKEKKTIEVRSPNGEEVNRALDLMASMKNDAEGMRKMINFKEEIGAELSGISIEEMNKWPIEEKQKVVDLVMVKAVDYMDFTKRSPK